jgi:hypothetical protein
VTDDTPTPIRPNRFVTVLAVVGAAFLLTAGTLTAIKGTGEPADAAHTPGNPYTVNVWTSGGQDEIDDCKGAVDLTKLYGVPTIAEHDRCGGDDFPKTAGSIPRARSRRTSQREEEHLRRHPPRLRPHLPDVRHRLHEHVLHRLDEDPPLAPDLPHVPCVYPPAHEGAPHGRPLVRR